MEDFGPIRLPARGWSSAVWITPKKGAPTPLQLPHPNTRNTTQTNRTTTETETTSEVSLALVVGTVGVLLFIHVLSVADPV